MSVGYRAVGWNRQKRLYDGVLVACVVGYLTVFLGVASWFDPDITIETLLIRGLGSLALVLLHVILAIGPLCRLDARFLPLLYNRRHLGVTMFLVGLAHGGFALFQFHALGDTNPFVSLLSANRRFDSLAQFPFELLGLGALVILFFMAATSHDFWLANLGAPVWKALHMGVYLAYALLLAHVALGTLQSQRFPGLFVLLGAGALAILTLHLVAGWRERALDRAGPSSDGWVDAGAPADIADGRACVITVGGERVAVFRHGGRVSALSNVCRHQAGPLGEGRIIDGCITCPWHGYQYRPEDGCSPPPFTERVATYPVRVAGGRILVGATALPPGTHVEPAPIDGSGEGATRG